MENVAHLLNFNGMNKQTDSFYYSKMSTRESRQITSLQVASNHVSSTLSFVRSLEKSRSIKMRRAYFHLALGLLMLVTGSINILSVKYADKLKSENTAGKLVPFNHPFLQACVMFLGKLLCMVAFYVVKWYRKKYSEQRAAISSGIEG